MATASTPLILRYQYLPVASNTYPASAAHTTGATAASYEIIEDCLERMQRFAVAIRQSSVGSLVSRIERFRRKKGAGYHDRLKLLAEASLKSLYKDLTSGLQTHLGQTVVARCDRLAYVKSHQRKLAIRRSSPLAPPVDTPTGPGPASVPAPAPVSAQPSVASRLKLPGALPSSPRKPPVQEALSATDPSTMNNNTANIRKMKEILKTRQAPTQAGTSVPSLTSSVPFGAVNYPRPPKASLSCSWCFSFLPSRITAETKRWR